MTECNLIAESEEEMFSYKNQSEIDQEKVQKCQEYLGALDEERKKIQVFERELPLCLHLVSQAIERCRQQMSEAIADSFDGQSDHWCADQTSSECPVLEEFIPMKSNSSTNEDFAEEKQEKRELTLANTSMFTSSKDWLASAQLSIQPQDPPVNGDMLSKKMLGIEEKVNEKKTSMSSSVDTDGDCDGDDDKGRSNKKERRCWSPELHRRFLHALQQLGGAHVATPKQIRETMKVNGLTNDEIKSHLQKYRLHTRRSNPTNYNGSQYTPQLVVVGRIWMPPLDYTANAASKSTLANDMRNNAKTVYPR